MAFSYNFGAEGRSAIMAFTTQPGRVASAQLVAVCLRLLNTMVCDDRLMCLARRAQQSQRELRG
jgi:hypothetical protein